MCRLALGFKAETCWAKVKQQTCLSRVASFSQALFLIWSLQSAKPKGFAGQIPRLKSFTSRFPLKTFSKSFSLAISLPLFFSISVFFFFYLTQYPQFDYKRQRSQVVIAVIYSSPSKNFAYFFQYYHLFSVVVPHDNYSEIKNIQKNWKARLLGSIHQDQTAKTVFHIYLSALKSTTWFIYVLLLQYQERNRICLLKFQSLNPRTIEYTSSLLFGFI